MFVGISVVVVLLMVVVVVLMLVVVVVIILVVVVLEVRRNLQSSTHVHSTNHRYMPVCQRR